MKTIYIIPIEPIDQRYTKQWYENIPVILTQYINDHNLDFNVVTIDGVQVDPGTTPGAFLDFGATNVYKASQTQRVSELFSQGKINPGDRFLVTDAWNFIITPIRYMSDLLEIPVEIHSIWHAGAYDPTDILGYKMSKPWPSFQEQCWFYASDFNYYATEFHLNMFLRNLGIEIKFRDRAIRSGQPHTPIIDQCSAYWDTPKEEIIIWPHRYNDDKQPEIAEGINALTSIPMIITQNMNLSKEDYYEVLGKSAVIFSCALHENLGISVMEAVLAGSIPVLPDRCSYKEMYLPCFKYPSEWTESYSSFLEHKFELLDFINERVYNRDKYRPMLIEQRDILIKEYLKPTTMVEKLLRLT